MSLPMRAWPHSSRRRTSTSSCRRCDLFLPSPAKRGKVAPKASDGGGHTHRVQSRPLHQLRWSPSPATSSQERTPAAHSLLVNLSQLCQTYVIGPVVGNETGHSTARRNPMNALLKMAGAAVLMAGLSVPAVALAQST